MSFMARQVARVADFQLKLFTTIANMQKNIASSLTKLIETSAPMTLSVIPETEQAVEAFYLTLPYLMPQKKPYSDEVYNYHGAYIVHHWDTGSLIRHSIISCLSGVYGAAYAQLRVALETLLTGAIYDSLARMIFRREASELKKIPGFGGAPSFSELVKSLGNKDLESSAAILDISVERGINPEASPSRLIAQLTHWRLLDKQYANLLFELLGHLSRYVHRIVPSYSDVGIRLERDMDWLSAQPVSEEIDKFLERLTSIAEVGSHISLNIIGPTSMKFSRYLSKDNLKALERIYEEAGYMKMLNRLRGLFGNL